MISFGIRTQKADVVMEWYNEKVLKSVARFTGVRSVLKEDDDFYKIIFSWNTNINPYVIPLGITVILAFTTDGLTWTYLIPLCVYLVMANLDWLAYAMGLLALRKKQYRGNYKKLDANECTWELLE